MAAASNQPWVASLVSAMLATLARLLFCAPGPAAAQQFASGATSCWRRPYDFETCCTGVEGHPQCWGEGYSFDHCCIPEMMGMIEDYGKLEYRRQLDPAFRLPAQRLFCEGRRYKEYFDMTESYLRTNSTTFSWLQETGAMFSYLELNMSACPAAMIVVLAIKLEERYFMKPEFIYSLNESMTRILLDAQAKLSRNSPTHPWGNLTSVSPMRAVGIADVLGMPGRSEPRFRAKGDRDLTPMLRERSKRLTRAMLKDPIDSRHLPSVAPITTHQLVLIRRILGRAARLRAHAAQQYKQLQQATESAASLEEILATQSELIRASLMAGAAQQVTQITASGERLDFSLHDQRRTVSVDTLAAELGDNLCGDETALAAGLLAARPAWELADPVRGGSTVGHWTVAERHPHRRKREPTEAELAARGEDVSQMCAQRRRRVQARIEEESAARREEERRRREFSRPTVVVPARHELEMVVAFCGEDLTWMQYLQQIPRREDNYSTDLRQRAAVLFVHKCAVTFSSEQKKRIEGELTEHFGGVYADAGVLWLDDEIRSDECSAYVSYFATVGMRPEPGAVLFDDDNAEAEWRASGQMRGATLPPIFRRLAAPKHAVFVHGDLPEHMPNPEVLSHLVWAIVRGALEPQFPTFVHLSANKISVRKGRMESHQGQNRGQAPPAGLQPWNEWVQYGRSEFKQLWKGLLGSSVAPDLESLSTYCCAQFYVSLDIVRLRSVEFFRRAFARIGTADGWSTFSSFSHLRLVDKQQTGGDNRSPGDGSPGEPVFGSWKRAPLRLRPEGAWPRPFDRRHSALRHVSRTDLSTRTPCQLMMYVWSAFFGSDLSVERREHQANLPMFMKMGNIEVESLEEEGLDA